MSRVVVVFGQFGAAADPANLPAFNARLRGAGIDTILIQHDDTKDALNFLSGYKGRKGFIGASLGAMSIIVFARYLGEPVDFAGGFQPSDFDPSGVQVAIEEDDPPDLITRGIYLPSTIKTALCFRNPVLALTGGLGHATWIANDPEATKLTVVKRADPHPGDFGQAANEMFVAVLKAMS